jgi:Bacterial TSP3 repeat
MRALFLSLVGLLCVVTVSQAQIPQPSPTLTEGTSNTWNLDWEGVPGRTYFMQQSDDLVSWQFFPMIEIGYGYTIPYGFTSSAEKCFVRLVYTDDPIDDPYYGDFDGDGVSNWDEVNVYGTNPLNADSDGDGVPDGADTAPNDDSVFPAFWWQRTTRELQYDFDDYEPPNNHGILERSALWDSSLNSTEQLSAAIPFPALKGRLEELAFPTTLLSAQGAGGLEPAGGYSTLLPNPPCYHATLNHHRHWLRLAGASDVVLHRTVVFITERSVDDVEQSKVIETETLTIPTGELVSEESDIEPGFQSDFSGNEYHSEQVSTKPYEVKVERDEDAVYGNWKPLAGKLAKALPGERINLRVDTSNFPANVTVGGFEWVLPAKVFKDYTTTNNKGELVPLVAADLNQPSLGFYFTTDGLKDVRVKFNVDGTAVEAKATIKVEKPTSTFTTVKGAVRLGAGPFAPLVPHSLGFLGATDAFFGVKYIGSVTTPAGWPDGKFVYAQLIKSKRNYTNPPSGNATVLGDGVTWKHDGPFPYGGAAATFTANGQVINNHGDSPSEAADSDLRTTIEIAESFQTYLMFRPDGSASCYVPLRKINWNWGAKATAADSWAAVTDPVSVVDAASVETDLHPEWNDNARNDQEQNVN